MNRIIGFPDVLSDLVIYVAIPQYRFFFIDFSGCYLFRMLCLPSVGIIRCLHSESAIISRDRGHPYKLPDLWPPNSPDLNPISYKIRDIVQ